MHVGNIGLCGEGDQASLLLRAGGGRMPWQAYAHLQGSASIACAGICILAKHWNHSYVWHG